MVSLDRTFHFNSLHQVRPRPEIPTETDIHNLFISISEHKRSLIYNDLHIIEEKRTIIVGLVSSYGKEGDV